MSVRRITALGRGAALAGAAVVAALLPGLPAFAHGAPTSPVSRQAACAAGGGLDTGAAACKAALKANGGAFGTFDDIRVPNVNGNDKKFVPDGKLCSGALGNFKGLDIARDDFPATTVTGGKKLTVKYRATVAHQGTFRVYITKQGYSPLKKLTWEDLGSSPIGSFTNPPLKGGAFTFTVKMPTGRTGRQMLYIVWQTSNTPDSYYSCSDLVFKSTATATPTKPPSPAAAKASPVKKTASKAPSSPAPAATKKAAVPVAAAASATTSPAPTPQSLTRVSDEKQGTLGHGIIAGALIIGFGALAWAGFGALRRRRVDNR